MNFPSHPSCTLCPLHTEAHSVGIPTTWVPDSLTPGPDVPSVLFIGQQPGVEEDQQGLPFVGESGKFFRQVYLKPNDLLERATIYVTNGVRCGPHVEKNIGPFNKCLPYTLDDVLQIHKTHAPCKPRLMFISALAVRAFFRAIGVGANINQKQSFGFQGQAFVVSDQLDQYIYFFSTYHPMVPMMYDPPSIHVVSDHLQILSRHLTQKIVAPVTEPLIVEPRMPE